MKNSHLERFISVAKLKRALMTFKELGNEYYQFVDTNIDENRFDLDALQEEETPEYDGENKSQRSFIRQ